MNNPIIKFTGTQNEISMLAGEVPSGGGIWIDDAMTKMEILPELVEYMISIDNVQLVTNNSPYEELVIPMFGTVTIDTSIEGDLLFPTSIDYDGTVYDDYAVFFFDTIDEIERDQKVSGAQLRFLLAQEGLSCINVK